MLRNIFAVRSLFTVVLGLAPVVLFAQTEAATPRAGAPSAQAAQAEPPARTAPGSVPRTAVPPPLLDLPESTATIERPRDYVIGPGDSLQVGVFGIADSVQVSRVSNSGKMHLTTIGILTASGKTVAQLESEIAGILRERELVKEPWVIVKVTEVKAHPVYVLGEVMTPGQFQITNEMYLNDLLTLAQGFNEVATPVGYLYRRKDMTPGYEETNPPTETAVPADASTETTAENAAEQFDNEFYSVPIDFNALQTGQRPDLNLKLQPGDILYVPQRRREYLFIIGEVRKPGLVEIKDRQGLRLTQAVAQVGGPTVRAKASKMLLVRYDPETNARREMEIDFKKVLDGDEPDIPMQLGDVVYVPGSKSKSAGLALLGILPGVAVGGFQGITR